MKLGCDHGMYLPPLRCRNCDPKGFKILDALEVLEAPIVGIRCEAAANEEAWRRIDRAIEILKHGAHMRNQQEEAIE